MASVAAYVVSSTMSNAHAVLIESLNWCRFMAVSELDGELNARGRAARRQAAVDSGGCHAAVSAEEQRRARSALGAAQDTQMSGMWRRELPDRMVLRTMWRRARHDVNKAPRGAFFFTSLSWRVGSCGGRRRSCGSNPSAMRGRGV